MTISNPKPSEISSGTWSVEGGINRFTVNISTEPADNDLAGIIVIAKSGSAPSYPDDVFYKGPWQEFIVVDTDASNNALLPNTSYTVGVAAYDQFGSDASDVDFGSTTKDVTTVQVVTADIANSAVDTAQVNDDAITDAKIDSLTATKITAGTLTGSTIQTASTGKRFVVSKDDNEAHFYGDRGDATVEELASIGIKTIGSDDYIFAAGFDANNQHVCYFGHNTHDTATFYGVNSGEGAVFYGTSLATYGSNPAFYMASVNKHFNAKFQDGVVLITGTNTSTYDGMLIVNNTDNDAALQVLGGLQS